MRILLDHCVPKRLRTLLPGQDVKTARQMGWDQLKNGELPEKAALQFDVFVTIDKKLRVRIKPHGSPIAVVIIDSISMHFSELAPFGSHLQPLLNNPLPKALHILRPDGRIDRL